MAPAPAPRAAVPARWLVVMAFAVIYLVWGSTFLGIRFAVESIPPLTMAGVRFLCAGLVLWLLSQRAGGSHDAPAQILGATPRQWRNALITGSLFFLGNHDLVSTAAQHIPSSLACLIIATEVPIIAVLSSMLLPNQPLTRRAIFGAALGISGVLWLFISQGASGATGTLIPSLAVLGASLCWSTGAVLSQRLDLPSNALRRAGMQMTCGGLLLCLASLAKGEPFSIQWSEITLKSILAMAYLTTFGSILAFASYVWLLKHVRADAVATHVFVNPLVAIILGSWLGGERLESAALVAGVLILCSVCIMTMRSSKVDTPEPA
jgi:drug/metabolite transporter (DMT)-like permease